MKEPSRQQRETQAESLAALRDQRQTTLVHRRLPARTPRNSASRLACYAVAAILNSATLRSGCERLWTMAAKPSRVSDCGPSESARSGQGCTSTISPSAPTAIAAFDVALTRLRRPVPCEG